MIVITVARKPVEGTVAGNVLKHGVGALNINGCRIGTGADRTTGGVQGSPPQPMSWGGPKTGRGRPTGGRWPANLIFQHKPECQPLGQVTVKGNRTDTRPEGDAGREDKSQWRFRPTNATKRGYSDADGSETITKWDCSPDCPIADLNAQSGDRPSTGDHPSTASIASIFRPNQGAYQKQGQLYSDSGGASRYFFQVNGTAP